MNKNTIINSIIGALVLATMLININVIINNKSEANYEHTYQVMAMCEEATDTGALLHDTAGNLWYVEVALEQGAEYMMNISDCGTADVEDDEILNVWREVRT